MRRYAGDGEVHVPTALFEQPCTNSAIQNWYLSCVFEGSFDVGIFVVAHSNVSLPARFIYSMDFHAR